MSQSASKNQRRLARQRRARRRLRGSAARPRLNVFRSLNHIYAQLVDDDANQVLAAASSLKLATGGNRAAAREVGLALARLARERGIESVVFDRGGYPYHGRVQALAEACRESGLKF